MNIKYIVIVIKVYAHQAQIVCHASVLAVRLCPSFRGCISVTSMSGTVD